MNTRDYLFPKRFNRRDFLKLSGAAAATISAGVGQAESQTPVRLGSGAHTYEAVENWGKLPAGMKYGLGCGIVVDSKDRIYITSRSTNPCVAIFDRDGGLIETWSNDFAQTVGYSIEEVKDTAHGIYWSKEGNEEFLYLPKTSARTKKDRNSGSAFIRRILKEKFFM